MNNVQLVELAKEVRKNAYAPYSKFFVGAAAEFEDNNVFVGCNVESSSYGATCCAERVAIQNGISKGFRKLKKIAVVGTGNITYPCGICRQFIAEFSDDCKIVLGFNDKVVEHTLDSLLPYAFTKRSLDGI